jgi:integrase
MPASFLMSWEPTRRRWWKMYQGRRYLVSCRQLGAARETKEDSYQLANLWWQNKKIEIDGQRPNAHLIRELHRHLAWAEQHNRPDVAAEVWDQIEQLENDPGSNASSTDPSPFVMIPGESIKEYFRSVFGHYASNRQTIESVTKLSRMEEESVWRGRLESLPEHLYPTIPQERSVQFQVDHWLEGLKARVDAGQFGHGELRGQISYIKHFVSYLGEQTPIDAINEEKWAGYHRLLLNQIGNSTCSPAYARKLHRSARVFVEYLASLKRIQAPVNLTDKRMKFTIPKRAIEVFSSEEITRLLSESRDMIRLMILLALNCGMTQIDISDLCHDEVDWKRGRLTRKRSKTSDHANTPVVEYLLWPETFALLTRLRSSDPVRILVTKSGKPWVNRRETNIDSVRIEFEKITPTLTFKYLRKTAASMLGSHGEFRAYAQYFLSHAPSTVADAHYVRPNQERFDCAVNWLRDQFLKDLPSQ